MHCAGCARRHLYHADRRNYLDFFQMQARICSNLKYNLQNLKHTDTYMAMVDAIVSGPQIVRSSEAEYILGIGPGTFLRSRNRSKVDLGFYFDSLQCFF